VIEQAAREEASLLAPAMPVKPFVPTKEALDAVHDVDRYHPTQTYALECTSTIIVHFCSWLQAWGLDKHLAKFRVAGYDDLELIEHIDSKVNSYRDAGNVPFNLYFLRVLSRRTFDSC
jgi:hypothetical protein